MRTTPREELKRLNQLNVNNGFYGTHNQFAILIEQRNYNKASDIMNKLNVGFLWLNERHVHNQIYNHLLDGVSIKKIKEKFKLS